MEVPEVGFWCWVVDAGMMVSVIGVGCCTRLIVVIRDCCGCAGGVVRMMSGSSAVC